MSKHSPELWLETQFDECVQNLCELVKIPSVSFEGYDPQNVIQSANSVLAQMKEIGLENAQTLTIEGAHPYVYGDYCHAPGAPTVLLYAHHDVQPPMREEFWETPPFEPTLKDGRLYGRGTADDKAGILIHLSSIAAYLKTGTDLPVNLKVIIEGEEETGSEHLNLFLEEYKSLLKSDLMILADLANYDTGVPTVTTSLRGVLVFEIELKGSQHALHSGLWSGPIPDPAMAMTKLLASMTDENGYPNIPGLLEGLIEVSDLEEESYHKLNMSPEVLRQQAGLLEHTTLAETGTDILKSLWRKPSLVINSMEVAQRKSAGNVLMDSAWARFGIRLAPGMDAQNCQSIVEDYLKNNTPWGMDLSVKSEPPVNPWYCSPDHPYFTIASQAMTQAYETDTVFIGCGASIPFVEPMSEALGNIPALLVGVEDPYCRAHGENESVNLEDFRKAILAQIHFYRLLGETSQ